MSEKFKPLYKNTKGKVVMKKILFGVVLGVLFVGQAFAQLPSAEEQHQYEENLFSEFNKMQQNAAPNQSLESLIKSKNISCDENYLRSPSLNPKGGQLYCWGGGIEKKIKGGYIILQNIPQFKQRCFAVADPIICDFELQLNKFYVFVGEYKDNLVYDDGNESMPILSNVAVYQDSSDNYLLRMVMQGFPKD